MHVPQFHTFNNSWDCGTGVGLGRLWDCGVSCDAPGVENGGAEHVGVMGLYAGTNRTNLISQILFY